MSRREYKIAVELVIKAKSKDDAVSKAWAAMQYGYIETVCTAPPEGLKTVEIDGTTVIARGT